MRLWLILVILHAAILGSHAQDETVVSVLGYHQFDSSKPNTEMRIQTPKFRQQMQALKDAAIPVISMDDFVAWKRGDKSLPPRCAMITIDDGFDSVYTQAFPILKEFGYPFTLFLYSSYINRGGRALKSEEIREMQKFGATIGGHSATHPLPSIVRKHHEKGTDHFRAFLTTELKESKAILEQTFDTSLNTYAYPGGFFLEDMFPIAAEFGYEFLFTVKPAKVRRESPNAQLPRYIILGNHDQYFNLATRFVGARAADRESLEKELPFPASPKPGETVESRLPMISADLSPFGELDTESIKLTVSGFGTVDHTFDPSTSQLKWQVPRPLRLEQCDIELRFKKSGAAKFQPTQSWSFLIDLEASYIPNTDAE